MTNPNVTTATTNTAIKHDSKQQQQSQSQPQNTAPGSSTVKSKNTTSTTTPNQTTTDGPARNNYYRDHNSYNQRGSGNRNSHGQYNGYRQYQQRGVRHNSVPNIPPVGGIPVSAAGVATASPYDSRYGNNAVGTGGNQYFNPATGAPINPGVNMNMNMNMGMGMNIGMSPNMNVYRGTRYQMNQIGPGQNAGGGNTGSGTVTGGGNTGAVNSGAAPGPAAMGWGNVYLGPVFYTPAIGMSPGISTLQPQLAGPVNQFPRAPNEYMYGKGQGQNHSQTSFKQQTQGRGQTPSMTTTTTKRKIEITTKSGELLDLKELHKQKQTSATTSSGSGSATSASLTAGKSESPNLTTGGSTSTGEPGSGAGAGAGSASALKPGSGSVSDNTGTESQNKESDAERVKKQFLEQVRLRKLAMDAKKAPEKPVEVEQPKEGETKETSLPSKQEEEQKVDEVGTVVEPEKPEEEEKEERTVLPKEEEEAVVEGPKKEAVETDVEIQAVTAGEETALESAEPSGKTTLTVDTTPRRPSVAFVETPVMVKDSKNVGEKREENTSKEGEEEEEEAKEKGEPEPKPQIEPITEEVSDSQAPATTANEKSPGTGLTMSELLNRIALAAPIEDIFAFKYPDSVEPPDSKYRKEHIKYVYGPVFLLQFKDKVKATADEEWIAAAKSKIVIPPSMARNASNRSMRPRDSSKFGSIMRNPSVRNLDGPSKSRTSSKRQSRRYDDLRSNRSASTYISRAERENRTLREETQMKKPEPAPEPEVAPLVPSANRWVPKFKQKKAEKKLAPDGVTELLDKEDVHRKMKSLLNKLTLEKFDPISTDIIQVANQSKWESDGATLKIVIEEIFMKATDEPYWSSMYAQLCGKVVKELDPSVEDQESPGKIGPKLVLHYLVVRCHTEFQKGWTDKLPTNPDGSPLEPEMMSDEYYEAAKAKRRGLGLVRFIGFLYRLKLLTGKMMFECFRRLMKDLTDKPSEEVLESVCELLGTVGEQFEDDSYTSGDKHLEGSFLLDSLFEILKGIVDEGKISNRIKFKIMDIEEQRENKWDNGKKHLGPKTIQQIHEEDERARQQKLQSRPPPRRGQSSYGGTSNNTYSYQRPNYNNNANSNNYNNRNYRRDSTRDSFVQVNAGTNRFSQRNTVQKEEPVSRPVTTNRFDALMSVDEDE